MNMQGGFYWGSKDKYFNTKDNYQLQTEINNYLENDILRNEWVYITPFNEGTYGYILLITFRQEYLRLLTDDSTCFRNYYQRPCERILLKLCYIDQTIQQKGSLHERTFTLSSGIKTAVCHQSFIDEVNTQIDVFNKTSSEFKPITPNTYIFFYKKTT